MEESSTNSTVRVIIEGMSKRNLLETLLPTKVMTSLGNSKILVTIKDLKKNKIRVEISIPSLFRSFI